ncbi:MAG: hypothetical protein IJE19_00120 [Clostridia bacterium]|nr:hypothetical protein [Clostridia bacterium]MBQ4626026.1 hypothetical protein [Clostridia bacterium]
MKKAIIAIFAVIIVAAIAVGGYFIFNSDDKNPEEITLTAIKDDFVLNDNLLVALVRNPDRYQAALANEYGMGEAKAAEFYQAPENWLAFEQIIEITNNSVENITIYGFEVENNGKNGIYVNTNIGGELGISPNGTGPASFSVLFENGDLSTDEAKALIDELNINVVYTKSPAEYDDGSESIEETKTAAIEKSDVI